MSDVLGYLCLFVVLLPFLTPAIVVAILAIRFVLWCFGLDDLSMDGSFPSAAPSDYDTRDDGYKSMFSS